MCLCVRVHACACVCMRVRACACVCVCVDGVVCSMCGYVVVCAVLEWCVVLCGGV